MLINYGAGALASVVPLRARRYLFYTQTQRRRPNVANPMRFTDKVNWRILHDRREIIGVTCDKLRNKELARARTAGAVGIPATLWSGADLRELASIALPDAWILKPTHRFGKIVAGSGQAHVPDLIARTRGWLYNWNWRVMGEWGYSLATPAFLVEQRLGEGRAFPSDYKFFVFDGVVRYVLQVEDRAADSRASYYDPEWNRVATHPGAEDLPPRSTPARLDEMIGIAEQIAAGFDFLRVDLYCVDGQIWFGETTAYPTGGFGRYAPETFDFELGRWWRLPHLCAG